MADFNPEGTGAALATVVSLATLSLVLPTFTSSAQGPRFSAAQLAFAAVASLVLYALFVLNQTVRHRDFFLPVTPTGEVAPAEVHADPPTRPRRLDQPGDAAARPGRGRRAGQGRVALDRGRGQGSSASRRRSSGW